MSPDGHGFVRGTSNEPIIPGKGKPETDWLAGAFGGKHFVQRIALDLEKRSREDVAQAWVNRRPSNQPPAPTKTTIGDGRPASGS